MIQHPAFPVEPWALRETELDLDRLAQTESVFALSNGHIGLRGNLDEGEPFGLPGTYLDGFYEFRPLPYAEAGYGYPESGQTVVNVTNGKIIRLLVDDEPFDVRYGELRRHERVLDLRDRACSAASVEWVVADRARGPGPHHAAGVVHAARGRRHRLRGRAARRRDARRGPVGAGRQRAAASRRRQTRARPRRSRRRCSPSSTTAIDARALLAHRTRASGLRMAAAMDHVIDGPDDASRRARRSRTWRGFVASATLEPGAPLRLVKFVAYGWSRSARCRRVRDQVSAALAEARHTGWDGLVEAQRDVPRRLLGAAPTSRSRATPSSSRRVRFALFHVLQAGARAEQRAIAAKGLTGPGYDGHTFWDTETFVLPVLTYTAPAPSADALRWRHTDAGAGAASAPSSSGCAARRSRGGRSRGEECSGYWPAGTAAFHINADIADAAIRYYSATGDEAFERSTAASSCSSRPRGCGARSATTTRQAAFRIDGVTGPDEYSAIADNNVYTNLMAQRNLRDAAAAAERHRGPRPRSGSTTRRRPPGATPPRRC